MREFNTNGPCDPDRHYMLPAQERLPAARGYIDRASYFVVHGPRQSGKTTSLQVLARELTAEGRYAALYFSCEEVGVYGDDFGGFELALLDIIRTAVRNEGLDEELSPPPTWPQTEPGTRLGTGLGAWVRQCPRPLVLVFDEIDAMCGDSLRSVLRQLRAAYITNRASAPHAAVLCGLRDVRDYKTASGGDPNRLGTSSPFNIKIAPL